MPFEAASSEAASSRGKVAPLKLLASRGKVVQQWQSWRRRKRCHRQRHRHRKFPSFHHKFNNLAMGVFCAKGAGAMCKCTAHQGSAKFTSLLNAPL